LKEMKELRKTGPSGELEAGEISFFELRGRELVLYWRDMKPGAKIDLTIDLIAEIPGEFRGPASRAYLYYTADYKHWIEPLAITITPR
jgi:alpha-2-macroglobulin-like protein